MKIHDVEQRSEEWHRLRAGIPTASCFGKIWKPTGGKSASFFGYICELIAESETGLVDATRTKFMERGTDLENTAIAYYELECEVKVTKVGFITNDEGTIGGSPDGLVGDDGGLEIKSRGAPGHVQGVLGRYTQDIPQVQGLLWLTGRRWWDLLYYNPVIPAAIMRVERDEKYISGMAAALDDFLVKLAEKREEVLSKLDRRPEESQRLFRKEKP
ncbi:hypothetical protein LCGC14_1557710 [marine sediment metagenome]|uniref:YqaJ viral recombinase domain-containing protein n=1 Tax=marine sediment metagenome TaxID=412755 RepID=A0A0F9INF7_9ZZZZ